MSPVLALQSLSSIGMFASRAFLPLLVVAGVARFPGLVSWLPGVSDQPVALGEGMAWLASDPSLFVLAVLSFLEMRADRSTTAREIMAHVEPVLKGLTAVICVFGFGGEGARELSRELTAGLTLGLVTDVRPPLVVVALATGACVYVLARFRRSVLAHVDEADQDGELGIARLLSRLEDLWAAGGMLLVVLAPFVALVLSLVLFAVVGQVNAQVRKAEERRREPCPECDTPVRPEATSCPTCGADCVPTAAASSTLWPDRWPARLGLGGDGSDRDLQLLARGRCPACAELRSKDALAAFTPCSCGWPGDASTAELMTRLLGHIRNRAIVLGLVCAALGLLPLVGTVAGLLLGRLRVAVPLRRFLPLTSRISTRWTARIFIALLLLPSGIPVLATVSAPLIPLVYYLVHRRALVGEGESTAGS